MRSDLSKLQEGIAIRLVQRHQLLGCLRHMSSSKINTAIVYITDILSLKDQSVCKTIYLYKKYKKNIVEARWIHWMCSGIVSKPQESIATCLVQIHRLLGHVWHMRANECKIKTIFVITDFFKGIEGSRSPSRVTPLFWWDKTPVANKKSGAHYHCKWNRLWPVRAEKLVHVNSVFKIK